jgi:hypothetical protein
MIKCRLLTGFYALQSNRKSYLASVQDARCTLCNCDIETRLHLLVTCPALALTRRPLLDACPITPPAEPHELLQVILDPGQWLTLNSEYASAMRTSVEKWSRNLCNRIHTVRSKMMANKAPVRVTKEIAKADAAGTLMIHAEEIRIEGLDKTLGVVMPRPQEMDVGM